MPLLSLPHSYPPKPWAWFGARRIAAAQRHPAARGKGPYLAASAPVTGRPLPLSLRGPGASRRGRSSAGLLGSEPIPASARSASAGRPDIHQRLEPLLPYSTLLALPSKYVVTFTLCQAPAKRWGQQVRKTPHHAVMNSQTGDEERLIRISEINMSTALRTRKKCMCYER